MESKMFQIRFQERKARRALLILSLLVFAKPESSAAAKITKAPSLRLAGTQSFAATPSASGATIVWRLDRVEVDESSARASRFTRIDSARGNATAFKLAKIAGKHTFYHVFATDNGVVDSLVVQVFPAHTATTFIYQEANNIDKPLRVYMVAPASLRADTRVVIVMHGLNRNAGDYIESWRLFVSLNNYLVLAPEFDDNYWPGSRSYNLGNMFTSSDGSGSLNPEEKWSFSLVEEVHAWVREGFGLADSLFDIWGHSAGAQFVHRMMLFKPKAKVRYAIPANAGWYTAPDPTIDYPYGVRHSRLSITTAELLDYTGKKLFVMRGTADTLRDSDLNTSAKADAQGRNRYQRAGYFYGIGAAFNPALRWQLLDVPNIGHSQSGMAPAAQSLLRSLATAVEHESKTAPPISFRLDQNYPNPFRSGGNFATAIAYELPHQAVVELTVYDLLGRKVATLVPPNFQQAGVREVAWDGRNEHGERLAGGLYLYVLKAGEFTAAKKMLLLR